MWGPSSELQRLSPCSLQGQACALTGFMYFHQRKCWVSVLVRAHCSCWPLCWLVFLFSLIEGVRERERERGREKERQKEGAALRRGLHCLELPASRSPVWLPMTLPDHCSAWLVGDARPWAWRFGASGMRLFVHSHDAVFPLLHTHTFSMLKLYFCSQKYSDCSWGPV